MEILLKIDDTNVRRALDVVSKKTAAEIMAEALTKTAFDVADAERQHAALVFEYAGPTTRQFFVGKTSMFVRFARPHDLVATVEPKRKTKKILREHTDRRILSELRHLIVTHDQKGRPLSATKYAIPINDATRNMRGRVKRKLDPESLLKPRPGGKSAERGYINATETAIMLRKGKKRRSKRRPAPRWKYTIPVYRLVEEPRNPPVYEFYKVAEVQARRNITRQVVKQFRKRFPEGSRFRI